MRIFLCFSVRPLVFKYGVSFRFLILAVFALVSRAAAIDVYQEPVEFINAAFAGAPPPPGKLWITGELRDKTIAVLGHSPEVLRYSYWQRGDRTAWILDEIGKEQPITAGFVIDNDKVDTVKILIYRESRGWEIRHAFFTDQFAGIMLEKDNKLNKNIDGLSGATLSVNAIIKLTKLALLFHHQVTGSE